MQNPYLFYLRNPISTCVSDGDELDQIGNGVVPRSLQWSQSAQPLKRRPSGGNLIARGRDMNN